MGDGFGETPAPTRERPQNISIPSKIISGSAGQYHSLLLSADGKIYCFGQNTFGQCGTGSENNIIWIPQDITANFPLGTTFQSVSAGGSHSVVLDGQGRVFVFGSDSNGQVK